MDVMHVAPVEPAISRGWQDGPVADVMTTAQIDRLGERLRTLPEISAADLTSLQAFRAEHEQALVEVQSRIERVLSDVDQSARIKTIQTLHDKLRRQPTKLSRIQDVAGVRIVQDMDLNEQDSIVDRLQREFRGARIVDRRTSPTFGSRQGIRKVLADLADFLARGSAL